MDMKEFTTGGNSGEEEEARRESGRTRPVTSGGTSAAKLTRSEKQKQQRQRMPATRKGGIGKAENWVRERTKSDGNILDLLVSGKRDRDSPGKSESEKPAKKSAKKKGDKQVKEIGTKMSQENSYEGKSNKELLMVLLGKLGQTDEYEEKSDRELLIKLLGKVDEYEKERRKDNRRIKERNKMEIKKEIDEERKARNQKNKEMEQKIDERLKEMEKRILHTAKEKVKDEFKVMEGKTKHPESASKNKGDLREGVEVSKLIEKRIEHMEMKCEKAENEERKRCIVIRGFKVERRGLEKKIEEFVKDKLEVEVRVQQTNIIGREAKLILIKLCTWKDKEKIMSKKSKLGSESVYIDHDRSKKDREIQREIVMFAKKAKEQGKEVKIKFKRIEIEDKRYRWSDREGRLEEERQNF